MKHDIEHLKNLSDEELIDIRKKRIIGYLFIDLFFIFGLCLPLMLIFPSMRIFYICLCIATIYVSFEHVYLVEKELRKRKVIK